MTSKQLIEKYGDPMQNPLGFEQQYMVSAIMPKDILKKIPCLPATIYMNKDVVVKFIATILELIEEDLHTEIKTFDGCFNIRKIRGGTEPSVHSFGLAFDFNAQENPLGGAVKFSQAFLDVWRQNGWRCGADFARKDGMHFEYTGNV